MAMVPFLFGVAGRTELSGTALNRLLGDLGLSASAARALVARMRRDGSLASTRRGRATDYRLAGTFEQAFRRVRDHAERPPSTWTGSFHAVLYQVSERHRAFRDALRRAALLSGYGLLQHGVLIALTDRTPAIADVLDRRPGEARVFVTSVGMDTADAARAAATAWDLGGLTLTYRAHVEELERALADRSDQPAASASTLRRFADLARAPMTDTLRDPGLPPELLPDGWIGARLRQVIGEVNARFGPAAVAYVRAVLD